MIQYADIDPLKKEVQSAYDSSPLTASTANVSGQSCARAISLLFSSFYVNSNSLYFIKLCQDKLDLIPYLLTVSNYWDWIVQFQNQPAAVLEFVEVPNSQKRQ